MRILILGGTQQAQQLAARLVELGDTVTSSLAGRTRAPAPPAGEVRIGGFGGAGGLADYLARNPIDHLVDATHPFAAQMSAHAVAAAECTGVPLLRLTRPGWVPPDEAPWIEVNSVADAAAALPTGAQAFITTGQGGLEAFIARSDATLLVRLIEPPQFVSPPHMQVMLSRPPYPLEAERKLLIGHGITHLVSKNSGSAQTAGKIEAARLLGVAVIMVRRPALPPAAEVATVEAAVALLHPASLAPISAA